MQFSKKTYLIQSVSNNSTQIKYMNYIQFSKENIKKYAIEHVIGYSEVVKDIGEKDAFSQITKLILIDSTNYFIGKDSRHGISYHYKYSLFDGFKIFEQNDKITFVSKTQRHNAFKTMLDSFVSDLWCEKIESVVVARKVTKYQFEYSGSMKCVGYFIDDAYNYYVEKYIKYIPSYQI